MRQNSEESVSVVIKGLDKTSVEYNQFHVSIIKAKELTAREERSLPEPEFNPVKLI